MKDKTIHHPYVAWASDEQRSMFGLPDWSLMGGFSSSSYIMLTRGNQPDGGSVSHHGNQLLVCIHNKVCSETSCCRISSDCYTRYMPLEMHPGMMMQGLYSHTCPASMKTRHAQC